MTYCFRQEGTPIGIGTRVATNEEWVIVLVDIPSAVDKNWVGRCRLRDFVIDRAISVQDPKSLSRSEFDDLFREVVATHTMSDFDFSRCNITRAHN